MLVYCLFVIIACVMFPGASLTSGPVRLACRWRLARDRRGWAPDLFAERRTAAEHLDAVKGKKNKKKKKDLRAKHWNAPKTS